MAPTLKSPETGAIDTSARGGTASVEVFGLPPGEDYLVELEATSEDGEVTCRGSAEFDVEIGVSTNAKVMLNCKLPARYGGVRVNGKFNICAELHQVVVSPLPRTRKATRSSTCGAMGTAPSATRTRLRRPTPVLRLATMRSRSRTTTSSSASTAEPSW